MTPLWTGEDVIAATGATGPEDWSASGVSIDAETVQHGDLYIHLGDQEDRALARAHENGAVAAIVADTGVRVPKGLIRIAVPDAMHALTDLARAARYRTTAKIIAVTGSVGKASTIGMIKVMLAKHGPCHVSDTRYGSQIDVPLSLVRMPVDTVYAVIKIGARHPGDIRPLSQLVQPDVALVTRIAAEHLANFGSIAAIAQEKATIFDGLGANGVAIFHAEEEYAGPLRKAAGKRRAISFGPSECDWALRHLRLGAEVSVVMARGQGQDYLFKLGVPGRHFAVNALGALGVVAEVGIDTVTATFDLAEWRPSAGRGTREHIVLDPANDSDTIELLDDALNANPTSVDTSLEMIAVAQPFDNVGRIVKGRRVVIFGDMGGLGADGAAFHGALAQNRHLQAVDQVHCAGPLMYHLWRALPQHQRGKWTQSSADLVPQVSRLIDAGDVVLVKGSASSKISLVVDAIRKLGHRRPQEE
ncbi:UDP-N-acetylmuramoyl-tripeptide--D-alanyl-D-alanine ligase [Loktanella sp. S4079]|uniref:UDP-N-acetylmuramoyl-tripeptide--D-alanyl-D- alanine ligase n=1 Tax=Loktanella sp. S4079 TaxID=579483 RepID=UPI0005FA2F93|nr:Mur ligase family protein [Loktanella sp. S4079]KJZ19825.1 UDP-N-acetylmuramoyl-tripeptide--D-alanyl-D-alanine ligase [Loktanella sp. S4079]